MSTLVGTPGHYVSNPARQKSVGAKLFPEAIKLLRVWGERATQRRHLKALTLRELDDIGVSAEAAAAEAAKPFWRA